MRAAPPPSKTSSQPDLGAGGWARVTGPPLSAIRRRRACPPAWAAGPSRGSWPRSAKRASLLRKRLVVVFGVAVCMPWLTLDEAFLPHAKLERADHVSRVWSEYPAEG